MRSSRSQPRQHEPTGAKARASRSGVSGVIALPAPSRSGGGSTVSALGKRRTVRSFSDRKLSRQVLSDLLWSARGVNRRNGPFGVAGITAASASNSQEVEVYVALEEGLYRYDATSHALQRVAEGDHRALALGERQGPVGSRAPVRLVFVADLEKYKSAGFQEPGLWDAEVQKSYYFVDTGLIAANVYLFAASRGLGAWFHNCNRAGFAALIGLRDSQRVLFGQTVGYPGKD